jgi:serine/threonine protein kinase/formylglycine-generating enzyme required for sulfatase activity/dienelactone hydrolase
MELSPGTRLGRYEVRSRLGAGGMGEVFVAYDEELEREVAIKVIREDVEESSDRSRRFLQEAKAASALNHPNVAHVYEIGSQDGVRFIAMELVSGETLRQRLRRGPMSLDDAIGLGIQIAAGLAAAHAAGIIHRDIKPENVMIRPDGYAKVLDFGLAKLGEARNPDAVTQINTRPGAVMGTLSYMSPEQISGSEVTRASDVFSFGVVLYEMVAGHRPFEGTSATAIAAGILATMPTPVSDDRPGTPPKVSTVINKALAKKPAERYADAGEMLEELRLISRESTEEAVRWHRQEDSAAQQRARVRRVLPFAAIALIVVLGSLSFWRMTRAKRVRDAQASITNAEGLLAKRDFSGAYDTALAAAAVLPSNVRAREVIMKSSQPLSIRSEPPGADVFLQRMEKPSERLRAGTTPLLIQQIARGHYLVTVEKPGFVAASRTVSTVPIIYRGTPIPDQPDPLDLHLLPTSKAVPGMVYVSGGEYRLTGWSRPSDRAVQLREFLIDRYEVSNREFEEFVRAGGYRRRELWKHPFVIAQKTIPFEEAMTRFRDTTSLPGPRTWIGGAPPTGRENHPVSDVTFYEAAAFAEWKGKKLPTVYQWEKAARHPLQRSIATTLPWGLIFEGMDATERANFQGKGTMPVDSMPFGISPFGAFHMAGNVSEWCRNVQGPGFATRGGSWNDPVYIFGKTAGFPAIYANATLGFRCVKDLEPDPGDDQGGFALGAGDVVPVYHPVSDAAFAEIRTRYDYVRGPLHARIVRVVNTPDWRRETIEFTVGPGRTAVAYLYLPLGYRRPLQVIHFAPAGDVVGGWKPLTASIESNLPAFIRSGRAVFSVALAGFFDRPAPPDFTVPDSRSPEYVEYVVAQVTELRRGLDYLESRQDLDTSRIAFMGPSAGSWAGVLLTAVEPRYRSVLFIGSGIDPSETTDVLPTNRIHFAPHIAAPKLMIQGRYDEDSPLKTEGEPLFSLFREPKRMHVYEGGHAPPSSILVPVATKWFDETLGPVPQ